MGHPSQNSVIVLGAGGHAKVLVDSLQSGGQFAIQGLIDKNPEKKGQTVLGAPVLGSDDVMAKFGPDQVRLVNGIGTITVSTLRKDIFEKYKQQGYHFASVIHPSSIVAKDATIAEGAQIMAGCVVQSSSVIGKNTIINTGAIIDHDCEIGDHTHIAPGAVLSGGVKVGDGSHIGVGANIIQGIRIGKNCLVAAGATVVQNVPDGTQVAGLPAKEMKS